MQIVYQMTRRGAGERHADDGTGKPRCQKAIVNGWNRRITETAEGEPTCKACQKLIDQDAELAIHDELHATYADHARCIETRYETIKRDAFKAKQQPNETQLEHLRVEYQSTLILLLGAVVDIHRIRFGVGRDTEYWQGEVEKVKAGNLYSMLYTGLTFGKRMDYTENYPVPEVAEEYYRQRANAIPELKQKQLI